MPNDFATRLFEAFAAYSKLDDDLYQTACFILGVDPLEAPFDDITHDYYDLSFELKGARDGLIFTPEQWQQFRDIGFACAWICHIDGSEQYYSIACPRGVIHKPADKRKEGEEECKASQTEPTPTVS